MLWANVKSIRELLVTMVSCVRGCFELYCTGMMFDLYMPRDSLFIKFAYAPNGELMAMVETDY